MKNEILSQILSFSKKKKQVLFRHQKMNVRLKAPPGPPDSMVELVGSTLKPEHWQTTF